MRADREKWDDKYRGGEVAVAGEPELVKHINLLPGPDLANGRALELACGKGANALYLGSLGYRVLAVDGSIEGLKICNQVAEENELVVGPVVMDLDNVTLPEEKFAVVSVVRYLNRDLFPIITNCVAPGGVVFFKTFNQRHLKSRPGFNPGFLLADGELQKAFAELELLRQNEEAESSWILARKPLQ